MFVQQCMFFCSLHIMQQCRVPRTFFLVYSVNTPKITPSIGIQYDVRKKSPKRSLSQYDTAVCTTVSAGMFFFHTGGIRYEVFFPLYCTAAGLHNETTVFICISVCCKIKIVQSTFLYHNLFCTSQQLRVVLYTVSRHLYTMKEGSYYTPILDSHTFFYPRLLNPYFPVKRKTNRRFFIYR